MNLRDLLTAETLEDAESKIVYYLIIHLEDMFLKMFWSGQSKIEIFSFYLGMKIKIQK